MTHSADCVPRSLRSTVRPHLRMSLDADPATGALWAQRHAVCVMCPRTDLVYIVTRYKGRGDHGDVLGRSLGSSHDAGSTLVHSAAILRPHGSQTSGRVS